MESSAGRGSSSQSFQSNQLPIEELYSASVGSKRPSSDISLATKFDPIGKFPSIHNEDNDEEIDDEEMLDPADLLACNRISFEKYPVVVAPYNKFKPHPAAPTHIAIYTPRISGCTAYKVKVDPVTGSSLLITFKWPDALLQGTSLVPSATSQFAPDIAGANLAIDAVKELVEGDIIGTMVVPLSERCYHNKERIAVANKSIPYNNKLVEIMEFTCQVRNPDVDDEAAPLEG